MAEYIEREAVLKIIADNCPHDKGGYNTEEEMGAGAACYYIRKDVDNIPTANVAPIADTVRKMKERLIECFNNEVEHLAIYTEAQVLFIIDQIAKEMVENG